MDAKLLEEVRKVTKGILIFDIIVILLSMVTFLFSKELLLSLLFGSFIAILCFRLSAVKIDKAFGGVVPGKSQLQIMSGFGTRLAIYAIVLVIAAKASHLNILWTALGLLSTQIVILTKGIFIDKIRERRSRV